MINTSKGNEDFLLKVMEKTGVTREQAQDAYEKSGGDLLDAMIYAERTYGSTAQRNANAYNAQQNAYYNPNANPNNNSFDVNGTAKKISDVIFKTSLEIVHNGNRVGSIPIVVFILALVCSFSSVLFVALVAMFFNVNYRISGNSSAGLVVTKLFDTVYSVVQAIKSSFN